MNQPTDDFFKNLAGGMSRRKAFLKFLAGAGALGFLSLRSAKAGEKGKCEYPKLPWFPPGGHCIDICLGWSGEVYDRCLECGGRSPGA